MRQVLISAITVPMAIPWAPSPSTPAAIISRSIFRALRKTCNLRSSRDSPKPIHTPIMTKMTSVAGAPQIRVKKYVFATLSTPSSPDKSAKLSVPIGNCSRRSVPPTTSAMRQARPKITRTSSSSPAPNARATNPVVPMRRKPKLQ